MPEKTIDSIMKSVLAAMLAVPLAAWVECEGGQVFNYREKKEAPAFEIVKLETGLYLAKGEWGANVGFFVGDDGVFIIDAKATEKGTKKVVDAITKITRKPIRTIVFTHSDSDCVNGYGAYPGEADLIIGLKALKELTSDMDTYLEMDAPIGIYDPRPNFKFKPAIAFSGDLHMRYGSEMIVLVQHRLAHTGEDTSVCFPDKGVAFIGDLAFAGRDPLIQDRKGGNTYGLVTALMNLLDIKPAIRLFVPSHAAPMDRETIQSIIESIKGIHTRVTALVDAGRDFEDLKEAFGLKGPPKKQGSWVWPPLAVKVFLELTRRKILENSITTKDKN